jgi:uncharacterized membrane protein
MWDAHEGMGWWMVFAMVFWLLFWASIIYVFFTSVVQREHRHDDAGDAMDIARRRLASGEITPEQFAEIRRHVEGSSGPAAQG